MAEYLIQGTTLTSIANEIRTLSGTEATLSPAEMRNKVNTANEEVNIQTDLITQIKNTVDSLPEAGSSGESISYDTCTVNITSSFTMHGVVYLTVNANGELESVKIDTSATSYSFTCICNSFILVGMSPVSYDSTNANYLGWINSAGCQVFVITASNGETSTIRFTGQSGGS